MRTACLLFVEETGAVLALRCVTLAPERDFNLF